MLGIELPWLDDLVRSMTRLSSFLHGRCIPVRDGKGQKIRVTMLPESLVPPMQEQMESVRRAAGQGSGEWAWGGVLARCAGSRCFLRQGFRVIPGVGWCAAIVWMNGGFSGPSGRQRWRPAPHTFRHSFATQLLEPGCGIRTVQGLPGHSGVTTTMVYTHVLNRGGWGVVSPLDVVL